MTRAEGYEPFAGKAPTDDSAAWESTAGAISVSDAVNNVSRPITGVAPGTADTDAVNVAQFKVLESNGDMMNAGLSFNVSHRNQYAGCSKAALIEGQQKQSDTRKQENQELKEQVQNR